MDRFSRGTLPPSVFVPSSHGPPDTVAAPPAVIAHEVEVAQTPRGTCDLASTCPVCNTLMQPEHAHYRCATCGYRDSCCF